jgi:hypothetical protein
MRIKTGTALFFLLEGLVLAQAILSFFEGFLTVDQMKRKGIEQGLPFLWHLGMWGDILLISPLAALIVIRYSRTWFVFDICIAIILSVFLSVLMHWFYTFSEIPEAHIRSHALTSVGYIHAIYMVIVMSVFVLLYFFTPMVPRIFAIATTLLLIVHIFLGTHLALGVLLITVGMLWYPYHPLSDVSSWSAFLFSSVGLAWQTFRMSR